MLSELLSQKIAMSDYRDSILRFSAQFSSAENDLLYEIIQKFDFDPVQEQALVQAVMQQSRFDPNAGHFDSLEDDEDTTGICPHCINPPAPPLRDNYKWRTGQP